jgi:fucose 4-O-acetylase-like acetyltransferase
MKNKEWNPNIDLVKGVLILLVILGHIIPGTLNERFSRYFIYSFHMPLFIDISGYLILDSKLKDYTFVQLVKKYWSRVLFPWLIAVNVYFLINNFSSILNTRTIILEEYLNAYLYPYYHLWFILGFLGYIFLTWFLLKKGVKLWQILIISFVLSLVSKYRMLKSRNELVMDIINYIHYDLRLFFYVFFVLGMFFRKHLQKIDRLKLHKGVLYSGIFLLLVSASLYFVNFYKGLPFDRILFYIFNSLLLSLVIFLVHNKKLPRSRLLEFIGRNSLTFYLYHVIGKIVVVKFIGLENTLLYYSMNLLMVIVLGLIIFYLTKKRHLIY